MASLLGAAGVALGTTSCERRTAAQRVRFWAAGREGEVAQQLVAEFRREHPHIEVDVQQLPWSAAHEKLLTAYAGDTLPDLCQLGNTWVAEFAALDALEPLDDLVAGSRQVMLADYFEGFLDANRIQGRVQGRLYGLPWYIDTRLLFYRRDLLREAGFDSAPRTWEAWSQMMAAIKARVGPQRYAVLLPLNEYEPLLVLALQLPADLLRDNGCRGNFRNADFRRALAFYLGLFEQGFAPRVSSTQISNVWDEFARGYFSFYITGPWNIGEFRRRLPADLQRAWMTAPMPGPAGPGTSLAGGASLVIFRSARNKPVAWQLLEYLSRPDTQRRFHALTGNLPPRRDSWTGALAQSIHAAAFREQMERVRSPPKVPEWERIATEMRLAAERIVLAGEPVEPALAALDDMVDRILEKRRWMMERAVDISRRKEAAESMSLRSEYPA